jgi:regulator of sigma E protease
MLTALVFLAILMTAVLVHELAHYLAARSVGVSVRAFSVGMGPIVFKRHWRGTEWRLSLLPLGGYVDLPGMAASVDDEGRLQSPTEGMARLRLPQKAWVLSAGVIANYVLGTLLLASAVVLAPGFRELVSGAPVEVEGAQIVAVADGSRAAALGLLAGDRIVRLNTVHEPTPERMVAELAEADALTMVVQGEDGREREVTSAWPPAGLEPGERPLLGVQLAPVTVPSVGLGTALVESVDFGVRMFPEMVLAFVRGFGSALSGAPNEDVAGPVGM